MPTNPNPADSSPGRGLVTFAVSTRPKDSKISRRSFPLISLGRFPTQISILRPFPSYATVVFGGRAKQKKRNREMGLEGSRVPVTHNRVSRLHQAIILSSEQHATTQDPTTPPVHTQGFFHFSPKIFLIPPAQRNMRKRQRRIDYLLNNATPFGV